MKPRLRILKSRFIYAVKLKRLIIILLVLLFGVTNIAVTVVVQNTVLPLVTAYAKSYAKREATDRINLAVQQVISQEKITYGDLYNIVRNESGSINSIEINTAGINLFKAKVLDEAKKNIADTQNLKIPLGNVFNNLFMMGRGSKIPVKLSTFGFTTAEISGEFASGGINQTRHLVYITIKTEASVVLPYSISQVTVETKVPVTETIIVGNVPSLYTLSP